MKKPVKLFAPILTLLLLSNEVLTDEGESSEPLVADTATTTPMGHAVTLPGGWSVSRDGQRMTVEAPEGDSRIVLVDVEAEDAESAISAAWAAYKEPAWKLMKADEYPDWNGFTNRQRHFYQTSPNEQRTVIANAGFRDGSWSVWIYDVADSAGEKFGAQIGLLLGSLKAKGWSKESFAGKKPHQLNEERIAQLTGFIDQAMELTGVPGVGIGLVQDGKVVYAGGRGVRELGKPEKVDADTLFMVASNTKSMATMLLAKQVDQGKLTWKTPVTELMPAFRLGNDETTRRTLVEHLICACTGLPRRDMPWIFEFAGLTADDSFRELAAVQPTSDFGELFQYSNNLAAAAGYVGGHVAYPDMEIGAAFDKAMQVEVFDPLGMDSTTFDFNTAMSGNYASAHSTSIDGKPVLVPMDFNYSVIHLRPAGGAWSNVPDMLKYIQLEIDEGVLPGGARFISKEALFERRLSKVSTGSDSHYGMGLSVNDNWGVPVVHHGGDMLGHHSDMMWLPEHGVGAVVLTNGDPGWLIRGVFQRRLLEVLFDGEERALGDLEAASERYYSDLETTKALNDESINKAAVERLATSYHHEELGNISVIRNDSELAIDTGELTMALTTSTNPDGSISFSATEPGWIGMEFVLNDDNSLTLRDSQHEYHFTAGE